MNKLIQFSVCKLYAILVTKSIKGLSPQV